MAPQLREFFSFKYASRKAIQINTRRNKKIAQNQSVFEIADIGCGYGSFADYLNRNLNRSEFNYEGFDINSMFIEHCCRKFLEANIRFNIGSRPLS